jgi:hypothetical protein
LLWKDAFQSTAEAAGVLNILKDAMTTTAVLARGVTDQDWKWDTPDVRTKVDWKSKNSANLKLKPADSNTGSFGRQLIGLVDWIKHTRSTT